MRRSTALFLAVTLAPSFLSAAAFAADDKPHIERVEGPLKANPDAAGPGTSVKLHGSNFGKDMTKVEVLIEGKKAMTLLVQPEMIMFLVPADMKKHGKYPVEVKVAGTATNKVNVEILDEAGMKALQEQQKAQESGEGGAKPVKLIQLDEPSATMDRGLTVIQISGQTLLPDGAGVKVALTYNNEPILGAGASTEGGRFATRLALERDRQLYPGSYYVEASFALSEQTSAVKRAVREKMQNEKEENFAHTKDRAAFVVGGDAEGEERDRRARATSAISKMREIHWELDSNFAAAGRSSFKSEEDWQKWLDQRVLYGLTEASREKLVKEIKDRPKFVASGRFDEPRWRELIDGKIREELRGLARADAEASNRFVNLPRAARTQSDKLARVIHLLTGLTSTRSRELYERNGLELSPLDPAQEPIKSSDFANELLAIEQEIAADEHAAAERAKKQ